MRGFALIALLLAGLTGLPGPATANDTYVPGYTRRDGTYVEPHHRTNPDSNLLNNYGTQGNINPYTGRAGTVDPFRAPPAPSFNSPSYGGNAPYGSNRRW